MKVLKAFEFKAKAAKGKYDWAKLLDGNIYQLQEGKDFTAKAGTFATMARSQAKKAGVKLNIEQVEGGVVLQAVKKEE